MDAIATPASFSADLSGCDALRTLTADEVAARFVAALDRAGATIVETVSHAFPNNGLTCVLILRESHAVLHTWPETGTINIDIFPARRGSGACRRSKNWAVRLARGAYPCRRSPVPMATARAAPLARSALAQ